MSTKRVEDIEARLREASIAYYVDTKPIMSDAEFDRLRDELSALDPDNAFLQEVGSLLETSPLAKVKHEIPMGSLHKIKTIEEYNTWFRSIEKAIGNPDRSPIMNIQWKLDGISIELIYRKGRFVQALTRGNGEIGEDVTHSISLAKGFPKHIPSDIDCSVRAEAFILLSDWEEHLSAETKNPRNTAAGIVRRTDTKHANLLQIQAYKLLVKDSSDIFTLTQSHHLEDDLIKLEFLKNWGFSTVETWPVKAQQVEKYIAEISKRRDSLNFQVDGLVISVNDDRIQKEMGEHKGFPYYSRAWKFEADSGISRIKDVIWSMGSRGTIHPTAVVDPVDVCGVTIQNASLHNLDVIEELGVCIGDEVEIIRANDVIPQIVRVSKQGENRSPIHVALCPGCGKKAVKNGPHAACSEPNICPGVQSKRIATFVKKREIMFLGDAILSVLMQKHVKSVADLYRLTPEKMKDSFIGDVMSKKILAQIEKSKDVSLAGLIGSLSVDLCGRSEAANIVANGIDTIEKWESLTPETLMAFEGFQDVKAKRICDSISYMWPVIAEVASFVNIRANVKTDPVSGSLSGKSFCFTGSMERPRKELESLVESHGGEVSGSVSKGLTYLVMADPHSASTKADKARKLGTQTISESDFLALIGY